MTRCNIYTPGDAYLDTPATLAGWFDDESAIEYDESTRWDGSNNVSLATGSEHVSESIYRTAGGRWVVRRSSRWEGTPTTYAYTTDDDARDWLIRNEYTNEQVEAATGEPMPGESGRPEVGPQVKVRLTAETIAAVDAAAADEGTTRSAWIRSVVERAVM